MASASAMKSKKNSVEILANSPAKKVDGRPECGAVYGMRCRCPRCHPASSSKSLKKRGSKIMQPSPVSAIFGSSTTKEFEQVSTAKAKIPPKPPAKDIRSKTISQQLPSDLSPAQAPTQKANLKPTFKQLQRSRESLSSHKDLISDSDEELVHEPPEFFDEEADDNDQKWMQTRLRGRVSKKSDAKLSCPGCFTTVCLQCQRHDTYRHQYRAVNVTNCLVLTSQQFLMGGDEPGEEVEVLHPVCCAACETEVGVRDEDNVYHFFEVIAESPE